MSPTGKIAGRSRPGYARSWWSRDHLTYEGRQMLRAKEGVVAPGAALWSDEPSARAGDRSSTGQSLRRLFYLPVSPSQAQEKA